MISIEWGDRAVRRLIARQALLLLVVFAVVSVVSCGYDDDPGGTPGGVLQISITTPGTTQTYTLNSFATNISIGGTVSESPYGKKEETACTCWGFGCLFDTQCTTMYYPRVHVTVQNSATGQTVDATLVNNSYIQNETGYSWHATVSLAHGENSLVLNASDGKGYAGSDSITIVNP
jgi:hypothetical protein